MVWMQPQLTEPPMIDDGINGITKAQHRLIFAYPKASLAVSLGVHENGVFDSATSAAVINFQHYINDHKLNTPPLRTDGVLDYATKVRMGVIVVAPKAPTKKYVQQGVGYNTDAFLMGNPGHSYNMAIAEEQGEFSRLALPTVGVPKVVIGYSMGDDADNHNMLNWPADRRDEIKLYIGFGSPSRPPGPTLLGNDPGGSGISGVYTPEWLRDRAYHFTHTGDMYANAVGLLDVLYSLLTDLAATPQFAMRLFGILIDNTIGAPLLGLGGSTGLLGFGSLSGILSMITPGGIGTNPATSTTQINLFAMITNIPAIIQTLVAALQFISTNAHYHYHDQPESFWRGMTAVDCAAQIIQEKVPGGAIVYTIPGTIASWNDGPPAWTAWKLP